MDCSPPGSFVHRLSQARILEWAAISFSREIFLTQGLNPCLLHWQADSLPPTHLLTNSSLFICVCLKMANISENTKCSFMSYQEKRSHPPTLRYNVIISLFFRNNRAEAVYSEKFLFLLSSELRPLQFMTRFLE